MTSTATAERVSEVRTRLHNDNRVSLSEFARGKEWRTRLATNEFLELQEHGERMAWIVSEQGMRDVVDYISELEAEAERASARAMFEEREGHETWQSGAELERDALAYLHAHGDKLLEAAQTAQVADHG